MKPTIYAILFLLLSQPAWGGTYYVNKTATPASPYATPNSAANDMKTVIDYIRSSGTGSNTVIIAAGNYNTPNDYICLDSVRLSNLSIVGAGRELTIIDPGGANHAVTSDADPQNVSFAGMTLKATGAKAAVNKASGTDGWVFDSMDFESNMDND